MDTTTLVGDIAAWIDGHPAERLLLVATNRVAQREYLRQIVDRVTVPVTRYDRREGSARFGNRATLESPSMLTVASTQGRQWHRMWVIDPRSWRAYQPATRTHGERMPDLYYELCRAVCLGRDPRVVQVEHLVPVG